MEPHREILREPVPRSEVGRMGRVLGHSEANSPLLCSGLHWLSRAQSDATLMSMLLLCILIAVELQRSRAREIRCRLQEEV